MDQRPNQTPAEENRQMADKHTKKCPTLHVIREMQIKTTLYHHTILEWPKSRIQTTQNADEDVEWQEFSTIDDNARLCSHFGRHLGSSFHN